MTEIAGRTVLVTGGASGLGRLMALRFARLGGRVVLWDTDSEGARSCAEEVEVLGGAVVGCHEIDVTDRQAVYDLARQVGAVDILVNNAGVMYGGLLVDHPDEAIETTLRVNTLALFWVTKAFLPGMIERGRGHVVTMASAAGVTGVARLSAYAASKHAAVGFNESLRAELRQVAPRIRTTVVNAYFVDTGLAEGVRTRFPRLLPILKADAVADRAVRAVQRNDLVVSMPFMVKTAPWIRLLPVRAVDRIAESLGVHDAMREFVGRHGNVGAR